MAISIVRSETEFIIVLSAPAVAPIASKSASDAGSLSRNRKL